MATSTITNLTNIKELSDGGSAGTRMGQSASDLVSFHGVAPVAQAAIVTSITTTAPVSGAFGFETSAQAISVITALNAIIVALKAKGLISTT
jgi:hypothetical protein